MYMLMLSEVVNQKIKSNAGKEYERVIKESLILMGIPENSIKKSIDSKNEALEYDFLFDYGGRVYGISAKRTLRERYKQFPGKNEDSDADIFIQITLGTDLNENKMDIIRSSGVYIFVADEIYDENLYMQKKEGVFSGKDFTLNTLKDLK